jgi:succinate dehydrogenase/fumarate reductase flavoprotein subunit
MNAIRECDLVIAGSGASGLAAAVTAAHHGLDVRVLDKAAAFGGTTVSSAGVAWIPNSHAARENGIKDSPEAALAYLQAQGGNRLDLPKAQVYVNSAADVLQWFEVNSHVRFVLAPGWPDYHPTEPGGSAGGRSLGPAPFDGRTLGNRFSQLRPPLSSTMIMGGMIVGREDLIHFYGMQRSLGSALTVAKRFARYARDRLTYRRGTRLSNGSALVAMLARSAFEAGVELQLHSPVTGLVIEDGVVKGVKTLYAGTEQIIRARRGVILATGGFPADPELRSRVGDRIGTSISHRTLAPAENVGDGYRLAEAQGGVLEGALAHPAAWTPVSLVPQPDGSTVPFPHFFDRGKAGYIAVTDDGRRFISEARSYHDFVPALAEACRDKAEIACHLIADSDAIRRYGLGAAPPAPGRLGPHVKSGYIVRAETLSELASKCGIDRDQLLATIDRFNAGAAEGVDAEFGKGTDVYERFNGSAGVSPNPCVQPIGKPPYYAIRLVSGDIGTFAGLRTNVDARVIDSSGAIIEGLYAVGNDAASFMGGSYPGAGIGPCFWAPGRPSRRVRLRQAALRRKIPQRSQPRRTRQL